MSICIFYHLFCIENSHLIFQEAYDKIKKSGLFEKTTQIHLMLVGPNIDENLNYLSHLDKVNFHIGNHHTSEKNTLDLIWDLCQLGDFRLLYLHSKGITFGTKYRPDTNHHQTKCVRAWKNYMEYFNIEKHELCLDMLKTHDTCGVELTTHPQLHYSGNFWWANSSYIRTLKKFDSSNIKNPHCDPDRAYCEFWATDSQFIKSANLHYHGLNLYHTIYSEESYIENYTMKIEVCREFWNGSILNVNSAWTGLEQFMPSIIRQFNIDPKNALEFGVDEGYSLHIFSELFDNVTGVDLFESDFHIGHSQGDEFYQKILTRFSNYDNIKIVRQDFRDYIKNDTSYYDLIHIDIVHFYKETYECAEWALQHSNVVILHDTVSFSDINNVCLDLSLKYGVGYYNIPDHHGLGILYKK